MRPLTSKNRDPTAVDAPILPTVSCTPYVDQFETTDLENASLVTSEVYSIYLSPEENRATGAMQPNRIVLLHLRYPTGLLFWWLKMFSIHTSVLSTWGMFYSLRKGRHLSQGKETESVPGYIVVARGKFRLMSVVPWPRSTYAHAT